MPWPRRISRVSSNAAALFALLLAGLPICASAANNSNSAESANIKGAGSAPDAAYLKLVDAAKADPRSAPWCEIRRLYGASSFFRSETAAGVQKKTAEVAQGLLMDKTPESVTAFTAFLRENAGSASAHYYAAYLYDWNSDLVEEKMDPLLPDFGRGVDYLDGGFEKQAGDAILACILSGADGRAPETAYRVMDIDEELVVVDKYYEVIPLGRDRRRSGNLTYDVVRVLIPGTESPQELWFLPGGARP